MSESDEVHRHRDGAGRRWRLVALAVIVAAVLLGAGIVVGRYTFHSARFCGVCGSG